MKKLIIAVLIPLLFSGCVSIGKAKVKPVEIKLFEFTSDLVSVTYLQRSRTTANVIAVVPISEISDDGVDGIKSIFRIASEDYRVKAVILKVDSPGGSVNASDLIWNEVMKFKKTGKPIVAFFNGVAASGGYYVSVPADRIIATPETWTGSIGVIMWAEDHSRKLKKDGIKIVAIKSGPRKDMLSAYKPFEKEDLEIMQRMVDSSYERFVQKVAQGRHIESGIVRVLADGRIYNAEQALKNRLIDQIGYIEDSFDVTKALAKVNNVSFIQLEGKKSLASLLTLIGGKFPADIERSSSPRRSPGLYYLWTIDGLSSRK